MADPRAIAQLMARRYFSSPRDQQLFLRQMGVEAHFQDLTSPAGAQGPAQIMPGTARDWGVSNPHDPGQAFKAAASHMADYVRQYGSWSKALAAYNAGPGAVGGKLPAETQAYIAKILGGRDTAPGAPSGASTGTQVLQTTTTPTFDQAGFQTARRRFALGQLLSSQGQAKDNPLFATGLVTTSAPNPQDFTGTKTTVQPGTQTPGPAGGGYINPFGSSLVAPGRVDEGVDPTIQGSIRAIGDAKVVNVSHNFYKGQPYIVYQLTGGPHAGRYVYVSELVTPHVTVGQQVRAGQTIATGHGPIETGWAGGPQGGFMPLANRAQGGGYTEGQATGPGFSFAHLLKRLGANAAR